MKTLIIARPDRVGDVIISTSCLAPIREKYPDANIFFVAHERMRPLLDGHPMLAGFLPLSADLAGEFEKLHADAIVHLHPDEKCYTAAHRAGIPVRIGHRVHSQNHFLTHAVEDRRSEGRKHEGEYNFDLLREIEVMPPAKLSQQIHLPGASLHSLQEKLPWRLDAMRFAVLHPSAYSKVARWPLENYVQLADFLQRELNLLPVFIGAEAEDSIPVSASKHLNLAGKTDLGELGWLLRHAAVIIGRDSGPSHLAAAVGCPSVSIFARNAPMYGAVRWRPLSEKAIVISRVVPKKFFEGRDSYWRRSFAAVTVEEVLEAAKKILK